MKSSRWIYIITSMMLLAVFWPVIGTAEEETVQEIMQGMLDSFALPLPDLFEKEERSSEFRELFRGFSGSFGFAYPLSKTTAYDDEGYGSEGSRTDHNKTLRASIRYNPLSYWFANVTLYKYLDEDLQAPWNPDFTYVFGYDDWHPYTFSLTYSNYGGNRFQPDQDKGEKYTRLKEGSISLGWKFRLPQNVQNLFVVHNTGSLGGSLNYKLTPSYLDLASLERKTWKHSTSLNLRYVIYKWLYANVSLYYYPYPEQQQPWDPDFTYGFGYDDWHPGTISVQYNNYAGNRYPWRSKSERDNAGTFKDGSITISWSWAW